MLEKEGVFSITHIESISNLLKPYFYSISGIEPTQGGGGGSNASSIFICLTDAFLGIIRAIFSKVLFIPQQVKIEKKFGRRVLFSNPPYWNSIFSLGKNERKEESVDLQMSFFFSFWDPFVCRFFLSDF